MWNRGPRQRSMPAVHARCPHLSEGDIALLDPRIARWAKTLVAYCLDVRPGQVVVITSSPLAEPLIAATYREVLRAGAHPIVNAQLPGLNKILLEDGSEEQIGWVSPADRARMEAANATLGINAPVNTRALTGVDPARQAIQRRAERELRGIHQRREAE